MRVLRACAGAAESLHTYIHTYIECVHWYRYTGRLENGEYEYETWVLSIFDLFWSTKKYSRES